MVTVYSRNICPKCMFVKSELEQAGIQYEEVNMDKDEQAKERMKEMGFMAAPIVDFDGHFEPDVFKSLQIITEIVEKRELQQA